MSSDNSPNHANSLTENMARQRRGSVTSAAFSSLFRSNSASQGTNFPLPGPITSAAINDQRRRLSVSTMGLSGTSPTSAPVSFMRRASLSTNNSDAIDENAVEEEEAATRNMPASPFSRRMSFGATSAMRSVRPGGGSPGTNIGMASLSPPLFRHLLRFNAAESSPASTTLGIGGAVQWSKLLVVQASTANLPKAGSSDMPLSPPRSSDQGFNWSDQLRSRAESTVAAGSRPSFSFASGPSVSPPRAGVGGAGCSPAADSHHERAKSISELPVPPAQAPKPRQPQKPDHIQERILKGDFYMD